MRRQFRVSRRFRPSLCEHFYTGSRGTNGRLRHFPDSRGVEIGRGAGIQAFKLELSLGLAWAE
jgi:hypothetical protein